MGYVHFNFTYTPIPATSHHVVNISSHYGEGGGGHLGTIRDTYKARFILYFYVFQGG